MKKRINLGIIIDTDLRFPPLTGVTYRLYFLSKILQKNNINVKIFLCNRNVNNDKDLKNFKKEKTLEFHIIPEKMFYSVYLLQKMLDKNHLDILQVEDPISLLRFQPISQHLKIPIILIMHDVESVLKKLLKFSKKEINISKKIAKLSGIYADKISCMTRRDYKELHKIIKIPKRKLILIPNPIDCKIFPFYGPNLQVKNVLFIGNMYYWPNQNAVKQIINKIRPRVCEVIPNCNFIFVGMVPKKFKNIHQKKNINFTTSINDINKVMRRATIAVCPVTEGSGMKIKILNYCAAGLPVITTTMGASGFENIKSLIIENDIEKYAKLIINNITNPQKLREIGKKNRFYVEKYFDINKITNLMIGVYKQTIKSFNYHENFTKINKIPLPLYLKEKRVKKITNSYYYNVKNGKIVSKIKI
jgi:glycosyltransferase involved in cell wall biosynthesis